MPNPFIWLVAGIALAVFAATNPLYWPHITILLGFAAWLIAMVLALVLSSSPMTARLGAFAAGLYFAVPCFLAAPPFWRLLLMCSMSVPLVVALLPWLARPGDGLRARLRYFMTWFGTREVKRCPRSFEVAPLLHLLAATLICTMATAGVKAAVFGDSWPPVRWLAGGIMILAWAEMLTATHNFLTALLGISASPLMLSPYRSSSLTEFWARRWNPAASMLVFHRCCFAPLARGGVGVWLACFAAFFASAVVHLLLLSMATGKWGISLMWGAFFLVQPLFIAAERRMKIRRWPPAAARVWTLTALAVPSPLFVEPALQLLQPSWAALDSLLVSAIAVLGLTFIVNGFYSLAALAFCQGLRDDRTGGRQDYGTDRTAGRRFWRSRPT